MLALATILSTVCKTCFVYKINIFKHISFKKPKPFYLDATKATEAYRCHFFLPEFQHGSVHYFLGRALGISSFSNPEFKCGILTWNSRGVLFQNWSKKFCTVVTHHFLGTNFYFLGIIFGHFHLKKSEQNGALLVTHLLMEFYVGIPCWNSIKIWSAKKFVYSSVRISLPEVDEKWLKKVFSVLIAIYPGFLHIITP